MPPEEDPGPCYHWEKATKPNYLTEVVDAIATVQAEEPQLFRQDGQHVLVLDPERYLNQVVRVIERDYGFCASRTNVDDEIEVKAETKFSERYDLITRDRHVFWSWTVTCKPPTF